MTGPIDEPRSVAVRRSALRAAFMIEAAARAESLDPLAVAVSMAERHRPVRLWQDAAAYLMTAARFQENESALVNVIEDGAPPASAGHSVRVAVRRLAGQRPAGRSIDGAELDALIPF